MSNEQNYAIIEQLPDGRIRQIGMTKEQKELLVMSMVAMSQIRPLVMMPEEHDLILKSEMES